ncbi:E3 ubiquitin-protein ligase RNF26 [Erpetoichthys calabaricus]|uniref:E3 ubiquitin-protein ligase RNF26 n=1 Tax=Erpetoichthys calabaricus TaxID=27687 RepID=UPI002234BB2E|nr:E3 ubiquitin-protein ligase RNF26 [Erpetoichthys calabaricus]
MGLVYCIFSIVSRTIEVLRFLLDLNFWIVSSLLSAIYFVYNLPSLLIAGVIKCWNLTFLYVLALGEALLATVQTWLGMLGAWLRLFGGFLESLKMIGNLFTYVVFRSKELLHRGLLSGQSFIRQFCEGCGIAVSLIVYFVNTMVNMLLIGMQNVFGMALATWETVAEPMLRVLQAAIVVFHSLSSSIVGIAILLWTPCQLALNFLHSLSQIFISVFVLNLYGLVLTLAIVVFTTLYLNPDLPRRGADRTLQYISSIPWLLRLQTTAQRLYLLTLARAQTILESEVWQRAPWPGSQAAQGRVRRQNANEAGIALAGPQRHPVIPVIMNDAPQGQEIINLHRINNADPPLGREGPMTSAAISTTNRPSMKHASNEPEPDTLLSLLKEHEERKKCVICQDSVKTVLLLPCRHLCLCRACTNILLNQPVYQHNCPLCRQMILQNMDVYL